MKKLLLALALAAVTQPTLGADLVWRVQFQVMPVGLTPFSLTMPDEYASPAECQRASEALEASAEAMVNREFGEGTIVLRRCVARERGWRDPEVFRVRATVLSGGSVHREFMDGDPVSSEVCQMAASTERPEIEAKVAKDDPNAVLMLDCVRVK